jgi:hypothetical protein
MTFLVTGAFGAVEVISDCESASEAMEVFRAENNQPVVSIECVSVTSPEDDMEDAFG